MFFSKMADCGEVDLSTCIPFYSHSDEGRSYKHLGLWILSCHGLLGRGTSGYLRSGLDKLRLSESEMGLNFTGRTWATQYIFTSMIKTVYSKYPEAQNEMVSLFTEDVVDLFLNGISSRDRQQRVHMIHMGHKGDLPALVSNDGCQTKFQPCTTWANQPQGMWWNMPLVFGGCGTRG